MEIKLLASGSTPWQLARGYWGLSFLVGTSVLFDTFAQYRVLAKRMRQFGVDASQLKTVVLSHEHWDHTGGLAGLLAEHKALTLYRPLEQGTAVMPLASELYLVGPIRGEHHGKDVLEQVLVVRLGKGLIVLSGCAHPGPVTIVRAVREALGEPVRGFVGGFHLMKASTQTIQDCAEGLKEEGLTFVAPIHCTGAKAQGILCDVFGEGYLTLNEGDTLN